MLFIVYLLLLFLVTSYSVYLWIKDSLKSQNFLAIYLIITFFLEISLWYYFDFLKIEIKVGKFFSTYTLFNAIFFCFYFNNIIVNNNLRKFSLTLSAIFIILLLTDKSFFTNDFNSNFGLGIALLYIFFSIIWFYDIIDNTLQIKISEIPYFWVSSGLLLWSVFFIFRIAPMYLLFKVDKDFLEILKKILTVINIIMYSMFFIALVKSRKITK